MEIIKKGGDLFFRNHSPLLIFRLVEAAFHKHDQVMSLVDGLYIDFFKPGFPTMYSLFLVQSCELEL